MNFSQGGYGLDMLSSEAWLLDSATVGGVPGPSCPPYNQPGAATNVVGGTLNVLPGASASFGVEGPLYEGQAGSLEFTGPPAARAFVLVGDQASLAFSPSLGGALLPAGALRVISLGPLDASGQLSVPFVVPELGAEALSFVVQGAIRVPVTGQLTLADPAQLVLLSASLAP